MAPLAAMKGIPWARRCSMSPLPSGLSGWTARSSALRWSKPMRSCNAVCPKALMGNARPKRARKNCWSWGVRAEWFRDDDGFRVHRFHTCGSLNNDGFRID